MDDADNAADEYLDEEFEPLRDASNFPEFPIENTELVLNAPIVFCPCVDAWGDLEVGAGVFFCEFDMSDDVLDCWDT